MPVRQLEQHEQMADDRSHERSTSLLSSAVIEVEKTIQTLSASHDATAVTRRERSFVIKSLIVSFVMVVHDTFTDRAFAAEPRRATQAYPYRTDSARNAAG